MNATRIAGKASAGASILLLASMAAPQPPFSGYAGTWSALYPSSPSLANVVNGTGTSCQLCHQSTGGGNGYNAYGWAIKQLVDGGQSSSSAMVMVEAADSDGDPGGFSNRAEIDSGAQPGWTAGPNNTIFFDDGSTTTGQLPPAGILAPIDSLSYPTILRNGTGVNPVVLTDTGGNPSTSPRLNVASEPFGVTLDCSGALANGVYVIQLRPMLQPAPIPTSLGEFLFAGPVILRFSGLHGQGAVGAGPTVLPYDLSLIGATYVVQGFCGSSAGGAFLSNALEQRLGI